MLSNHPLGGIHTHPHTIVNKTSWALQMEDSALSLCDHPKWHHSTWIFLPLQSPAWPRIRNGPSGATVSLSVQIIADPSCSPREAHHVFPQKNKKAWRKSGERMLCKALQGRSHHSCIPGSGWNGTHQDLRAFQTERNTFLDVSVGISLLICRAAGVQRKIQKMKGFRFDEKFQSI